MSTDNVYMKKALMQAKEALVVGEFPVGCIIVHGETIVATGARQNSVSANEMDHAEINALRQLLQTAQKPSMDELIVYSTMEPCLMCYSTLVVNGIRNIVYAYEDAMGGGTNLCLASLNPLYRDIEMNIRAGVMRDESLSLFQEFFKRPNVYLGDSYLAQYTLAQK